jgi:glutathione S-transferase
MAIEILWASGSPFAWRALLALETKRLSYESRLLEFSKEEHKTPAYLALNPRGKVPTLRDGDYVVYESVAILGYLDAKYPQVPLFGDTPEERGTILRVVSECDAYFQPPLFVLAQTIFTGKVEERARELREAIESIHRELATTEQRLASSPWLCGGKVSAADLVVFPFVQIVARAAGKPAAASLDLGVLPLRERYPRIAAWVSRVEQLPGYERTYPPHWRAS